MPGSCEAWAIQLRAGTAEAAIARSDGITLYGHSHQMQLLQGLQLDFQSSLSGGGFFFVAGWRKDPQLPLRSSFYPEGVKCQIVESARPYGLPPVLDAHHPTTDPHRAAESYS